MIYINVTNSFSTRTNTGIQRVVKQLGCRLAAEDDFVLTVFHDSKIFQLKESQEIRQYLHSRRFDPVHELFWETFCPGDVFFDMDGSWGDPYDTAILYKSLKSRGVLVVKMHYDAVPVLFPEFSHPNTVYRYGENFASAILYADFWLCISRTVEKDLLQISSDLGYGNPSTFVVNLGSDIVTKDTGHSIGSACAEVLKRKYLLAVGTVEPRKNYELVLDVYDRLLELQTDVDLVIVGKSGWNNDKLIKRLRAYRHQAVNVHWFESANDTELDQLYRAARLCLCLSHYEGYGLPVIEALSRGCPVICTADGAMEEVASGYAICVPPDVDAVLRAILTELSHGKGSILVDHYVAPTWRDSAEQVRQILQSLSNYAELAVPPRQAVYISIRPDALARSLSSVAHYMTFIEEALILTADSLKEEVTMAVAKIPLVCQVLSESELGLVELPEDHAERNGLLRGTLYASDLIESNFLAFDDDVVVIQQVTVEDFVCEGRHKAYYFYERMTPWLGAFPKPTSFDRSLWRTVSFLEESGYDTRLYNSHQPQIINKNLSNLVYNRIRGLGLDEWSSYFNIAKHLAIDGFQDKLYKSAGWPQNPDSWLPVSVPEKIAYYNDYYDERLADDVLSAAEYWRESISNAKILVDKLVPRCPVISIDKSGVKCSVESLVCQSGIILCIPVYTAVDVESLNYRFLDYSVSYRGDAIPNFLHLPLRNTKGVSAFNLSVEVVLVGMSCPHNFSLPILVELAGD